MDKKSIRVNITLQADVYEAFKKYCADNGYTMSGFLSVSGNEHINAKRLLPKLLKTFDDFGNLVNMATSVETEEDKENLQIAYNDLQYNLQQTYKGE